MDARQTKEQHPLTQIVMERTADLTQSVGVWDRYDRLRVRMPVFWNGQWCIRSSGYAPLKARERGNGTIEFHIDVGFQN